MVAPFLNIKDTSSFAHRFARLSFDRFKKHYLFEHFKRSFFVKFSQRNFVVGNQVKSERFSERFSGR